jgi:uncharacterized protein GlcG (DUF336 family)
MSSDRRALPVLALALLLLPASLVAQVREIRTLTLDAAESAASATEDEARRNGWNVVVAVVDPAGDLILLHRMDGVQAASIDIATAKARTAARFRRPTKALADAIAEGRSGLLAVEGLLPLEGGLPIVVDEEVVGAIGVSGMTGEQDAVAARAGIEALSAGER